MKFSHIFSCTSLFFFVWAHNDNLSHDEILARRSLVQKRSQQLGQCKRAIEAIHGKRALKIMEQRQKIARRDSCYEVTVENLTTTNRIEELVVNGNFELVTPYTISNGDTVTGSVSTYTFGLSTSTLTSIQYATSTTVTSVCGSASTSTITVVDGATVTSGAATEIQTVVGTVTIGGVAVATTVSVTVTATASSSIAVDNTGASVGAIGTETTTASSATSSSIVSASGSAIISGQRASVSQTAENSTCAIFPEEEEGPYYISGEMIRSNLVDELSGIPLSLHINLIDTTTCEPLTSAAVDIWSASPLGVYSGFTLSSFGLGEAAGGGGQMGNFTNGEQPSGIATTGAPTGIATGGPFGAGSMSGSMMTMTGTPPSMAKRVVAKRAVNGNNIVGQDNDSGNNITDAYTFARGIQISDSDGAVAFDTLVPGWYSGRTMHIHLKVHLDGQTLSNGTYIGGTIAHIGQMFFGEDISELIAQNSIYSANTNTRTVNDVDTVYTGQSGEDSLLTLYYASGTDLASGLIGEITFGIEPVTHALVGGNAGNAGQ